MSRHVRIHPLFDLRLAAAFVDRQERDRFVIGYLKLLLDDFADHFDELPRTPHGPEWRRTYGVAEDLGVAFVVQARAVGPDMVELRSIATAPLPR